MTEARLSPDLNKGFLSKGFLNKGIWYRILPGKCMVLLLLLAFPLSAAAWARDLGTRELLLFSAFARARPLVVAENVGKPGRRFELGTPSDAHVPAPEPSVRLWDDFGAFSPASIADSIVTIRSGGNVQ
jgi:hypothetical protein